MEMEDELERRVMEVLMGAGYFRAQISSLSGLDKITGGLAWCITSSNQDRLLDFDIFFYDDDASLGYKVKVGEAIEGALQKMGCPHPLQAHQIQGLDYPAVYPVVQWLVQRIQAKREALADQLREYAHLRFQENYELNKDTVSKQMDRVNLIEQSTLRQYPRLFRQQSSMEATPRERSDRIASTLMEYGHILHRQVVSPDVEEIMSLSLQTDSHSLDSVEHVSTDMSYLSNYEESMTALASAKDSLAISKVGQIMDLDSVSVQEASSKYSEFVETHMKKREQADLIIELIEAQEVQNNSLKEQVKTTVLALENAAENMKDQEERKVKLQLNLDDLYRQADIAGARDVVQTVASLLKQLKILEKEEKEFRTSCKKRRAEMLVLIQQLETKASSFSETNKQPSEVDDLLNGELLKLESLKVNLAKASQKAALLQRKLDKIPTQTELMQYESRFVELYLHIQEKLRETRKYYRQYNALAEANELTTKEISLLNSINSQFEAAMNSPESRSQFLDSMQEIAKGVQKKLEKMEDRHTNEKNNLDSLKKRNEAAVASRRHYVALVKKFQDECARNEKLKQISPNLLPELRNTHVS